MVTAWTNFIKGGRPATGAVWSLGLCVVDPSKGPRIPGWRQYNPADRTTLAILGLNTTGADPGDHDATDEVCSFWNTILPTFPKVLCLL